MDYKTWCERALTAVFSLWNSNEHHAWRTSTDKALSRAGNIFPTATFHAISAFGQCGVWDAGSSYKMEKKLVRTSYLQIRNVDSFSAPLNILSMLLKQQPGGKPAGKEAGAWVQALLDMSSQTKGISPMPARGALLLSGMFQSIRILCSGPDLEKLAGKDREQLTAGIEYATGQLIETLKRQSSGRSTEFVAETELLEENQFSPYLLLHTAICLKEHSHLVKLGIARDGQADTVQKLQALLRSYFVRQSERLMARRNTPNDPQHDPTSLAFAVRGLVLLDDATRKTPFVRACVQAAIHGQMEDGRWPEGISSSFSDAGDIVQQPSVDVAFRIAETVFRPGSLVRPDGSDIELMSIALPAFAKTAAYLTASYRDEQDFKGWVSDRVRRPGFSEMWVTALAAQFFHYLWLSHRSLKRAEILHKYNATMPVESTVAMSKKWETDVVEPDAVSQPAKLIQEQIIEPIEAQQKRAQLFLRPPENGVSYIIFGPPGSGKTYFVKTLAEAMGWPLLVLNPGHFIRNGLEHIEATSSEIFNDIMALDHVVVFFDECDELFRERAAHGSTERNILSFATASMLPKLQDLHDIRQVILFLGTNFLSHIDKAIRRPGRFDHILLFDRPDEAARRKHLKTFLKKDPSNEQVSKTSGWTIPEIKRAAEGLEKNIPFGMGVSIDDYVEWFDHSGDAELDSARFTPEQRKQIRQRWAKTRIVWQTEHKKNAETVEP